MPSPVETTQEFNIQELIRRYLGLVGERWFMIAVCVIIMMLIGFGLAQLWPNSYQSSTLFVLRSSRLVDDSALEKALNPAMALAAQQRTMVNEIRSHARIEEVLRALEWKEFIKAQMDTINLMDFYTKVGKSIDVQIMQDALGNTHVELFFTWNDPNKAARFCETMRDLWIDKKLETYEQEYTHQLDLAEIVLREKWEAYAQAKRDLEKFDNETQYATLGNLDELNRLKTEVIAQIDVNKGKVLSMGHSIKDLENQLATLPQKIPQAKQIKNPEWVQAFATWKKSYALYQKLEERLTDANSDLIKAREKVESARQYLDELESEKFITEGLDETLNPEYSSKSAELTRLRPEYEQAKETLRVGEARLEDVEEKIRILPGIMAERKYLNSEIDLADDVYQKAMMDIQPLRDRVSSFKTINRSGRAGQTADSFKNQTFEVLTRAKPATSPKNPMALIIMVLFTLIGLGLGLVFALAGEILKSSFSTQEEVMNFLKKPVLGGVNRIMTAAEIKSIKWRKVVFTSSSMLVIFSLIAIIYICNRYPELIPPVIVEQVNEIRESLG